MFRKSYSKKLLLSIIISMTLLSSSLAQTFSEFAVTDLTTLPVGSNQWVDINNDGKRDFILTGEDELGNDFFRIFINNGDDTYANSSGGVPTFELAQVTPGDFNNDGFVDLLLCGKNAGTPECKTYTNNQNSTFSESASLTGLINGSAVVRDLDNDGDHDLIITGRNTTNDKVLECYRNDGTGFTLVSINLPATSDGLLLTEDIDQDGLFDVFVSGVNSSGNRIAQTYRNEGNFQFTLSANVFTGISLVSGDFADLDANGFPDLITSGLGDAGAITTVFLNTAGVLTATDFGFTDLYNGKVRIGDFNNDGLPDVFLTGLEDNGDLQTDYYRRNLSSGQYDLLIVTIPNVFQGGLDLDDFDGDQDLDLLINGTSEVLNLTRLYENEIITGNTLPSTPGNLVALVNEDIVTFSWDAATDGETATAGLQYNLYVKNLTTNDVIVSPLSDLTNGAYRVPFYANTSNRTNWELNSLPEGNYEWSVQSLDASSGSSAFATLEAFTVCYSIDLGEDITICDGSDVTLEIGEGTDVVNWFSVETGAMLASNTFQYTFTATERVTVRAELTKPAIVGCTVTDEIVVDIFPLPAVDLGTELFGCLGKFTTLEVAGYDVVNWYSATDGLLLANSSALDYQFLLDDVIRAEVFSVEGCLTNELLNIKVRVLPTPDLGPEQDVCFGLSTTLELTGFAQVDWFTASDGLVLSDSEQFEYQVNATDEVTAQVEDVFGCINSTTLRVVANPLPDFTLGDDREVCFMENTTLSVTGFETVNWSSAADGLLAADQEELIHQVLKDDILTTEVIDIKGCVNSDEIGITSLALPVFDIGEDTALCDGAKLLLTSDIGLARTDWFEVEPTGNTLLSANSFFYEHTAVETDQLMAVVEDNLGCINSDVINIEFNPLPDITLGPDQELCIGQSTTLSIGMWEEIEWFSIAEGTLTTTEPDLLITPPTDDMIKVTVTDINGCVSQDEIDIEVHPLPEVSLGADTIICSTDLFRRELIGFESVEWFNEASESLSTENFFEFEAAEDRELSVQVTDANTCVNTDIILVDVKALPDFTLGPDQVVCSGDTARVSISTQEHDSLRWESANLGLLDFTTFDIVYPTTVTDNLDATLVSIFGCSTTKSVEIFIQPLPEANAGEDQLICLETSVNLGIDGNTDLTYSWSPQLDLSSSSVSNPSAFPDTTRVYDLTVIDQFNCLSRDTVLVEVNPETIIDLGGDRPICLGNSTILGADIVARGSVFPYTYQWSPAQFLDLPDSPNPQAMVTEDTEFTLLVSTGDCEADAATVTVTVDLLPIVTVTPDLTVGFGETSMLLATGGVGFDWLPLEGLDNNTIANPMAGPDETITYVVSVTDENDCISTAAVTVFVDNKVFIPSLFTPNGDGNNDQFLVFGDGIMEINFVVYDRTGKTVYETNSVEEAENQGWDGTFKGESLKVGSYLWSISGRFFDGGPISIGGKNTGTVKLLR